MSKRIAFIILVVIALGGLPLAAQADTINVTNLNYGYDFFYSIGGTQHRASPFEMTLSWGTWDPAYGYCIDPGAQISTGALDYDDVVLPSDAYNYSARLATSEQGTAVGWLISQFSTSFQGAGVTTKLDITALQLAIWEVIYDYSSSDVNSLNLAGGTFKYVWTVDPTNPPWSDPVLTPQVQARAQTMLNTLPLGTGFTPEQIANIDQYFRIGADVPLQDIAFGAGGGETPEPGTMLLLGSAMAMGGYWRRRRSRKAKAQA